MFCFFVGVVVVVFFSGEKKQSQYVDLQNLIKIDDCSSW